MQKEKILLKVHRSRKLYLIFYLLILASFFCLGYSFYKQKLIDEQFLLIFLGILFLVIFITEIHRIRDWWAITDNSFIESQGIFSKTIREINFQSIADIALDQSFLKRLLDYGTVELRKLMEERSIIIPNINRPERFINILRDAIIKENKK